MKEPTIRIATHRDTKLVSLDGAYISIGRQLDLVLNYLFEEAGNGVSRKLIDRLFPFQDRFFKDEMYKRLVTLGQQAAERVEIQYLGKPVEDHGC